MKKFLMKATALLISFCLLYSFLPYGQTALADDAALNTIGKLKNYLHESLLTQPDKIELKYSEELQPTIEAGTVLDEMLNRSYGVDHASWNWSWKKENGVFDGTLVISPIKYLNGIEIIRAFRSGTLDQLTLEQQQTFEIAQEIARKAAEGANTLMDIEIAIHDEICRRTTYQLAETDEKSVLDTAAGALLYGTAECDGYSDAFYLIGTLAGLKISFQKGRAVSGKTIGSHLWNLIEINGKWYHVDLTWDDQDSAYGPDVIRHTYLNAGSSLMETHTWDESLSPYIPEPQTNWDYFYYTREGHNSYCTDLDQAAQYIASCREKGINTISLMVQGETDWEPLHDAMKKTSIYGSWRTWDYTAGGYTFFLVKFSE